MLHPSYNELMDTVNQSAENNEEPIVHSRYSIVLGTAKRARQIIAAEATVRDGVQRKPLSIAVEELKDGQIHILSEECDNYEAYEPDENGRI